MYNSPKDTYKVSYSAHQYTYKAIPATPVQKQHINSYPKTNKLKSFSGEESSKPNLNHRKNKKQSLLSQITFQNFTSSSPQKQQTVPSKSETFHTYYKAKIFDNRERKFTQLQHISQQFGPARSIETLKTRAILYKNPNRNICNEPYKFKSDQLNHLNSMKNQMQFQEDFNDSFQPKKSMIQRAKRPFSVADLLTKTNSPQDKVSRSDLKAQIQKQDPIPNSFEVKQISEFNSNHQFDPLQKSKVKGVVSSLTRINTCFYKQAPRNRSKSFQKQTEIVSKEQPQKTQENKKEYPKLSDRVIVYEEDRIQFTKFLNSQWVKEMIESRSLKTDSVPQFHKNSKSNVIDLDQSKQINDMLLVRQQYKKQKNKQSEAVVQSSDICPQTPPIRSVRKYLKHKSENQIQAHDYNKQIDFLDNAFDKITKKQEQDQLAGADMFYDMRVRKRKFISHIHNIVKRSKQLQLTVQQIIDKKIYSTMAFEAQGSYSLFCHTKQGNNIEIIQQLSIKPNLVYEFDEEGRTILHLAIIKQKFPTVKLLVQMNASLHQNDFYGKNAFLLALESKNNALIQYICSMFYPSDEEYIHVLKQLEVHNMPSMKVLIKRNKLLNLKDRMQNKNFKEYFNHLIEKLDLRSFIY